MNKYLQHTATLLLLCLWIPLMAQESLKITPKIKSGSIKEILQGIESQYSINFIYDGKKVDDSKQHTLAEESYSIRSLILELFDDEVETIMRGTSIILKRKAQNPENKKVTISGYISEVQNGENLPGATIYDTLSGSGTVSNYYGFYSLTLPKGEVHLQISFVGTETQYHAFNLLNDTLVNVKMEQSQQALDAVIISAEKSTSINETTEMGTIGLSRQQIQSRPAIGGEVDVIKVLQLLPGVQSGVEGSAGLYVRGGGPDQNLILLDGVPVYNTSHLFGFSSVFNSDAINSVKLIKGAFPARYGGRLSSVVDMSMKEGNMNELSGTLNISPIASSIMLEGPIAKEKTSFMIAGRRSFIDLATQSFSDDNYYFYDWNVKLNHRFSHKDRIYFSAYLGEDKGKFNESEYWEEGSNNEKIKAQTRTRSSVNWGSAIMLGRWNHVYSPKVFSNLSLSYSTYDFEADNHFFSEKKSKTDTITEHQRFLTTSNISDLAAKLEFDIFPDPGHSIKLGVQSVLHDFKPNVVGLIATEHPDINFNAANFQTHEFNLYIEDDWEITGRAKANVGVHASALALSQKTYTSIQPRVSLRYLISQKLAIKGSYTEMTQFLHLLTNPGLGLPTDLWVPVTEHVPPQHSKQFSFGASQAVNDMEVSLEFYYKEMNGLIEYKDGANFLRLNEDWQEKINIGKGDSYGMELFLRQSWPKLEGWIGYTLAWSNRKFEEINFGKTFPYKYDRRHDVNLVVTHHVRKHIDLSANWVYGSGIAVTLPSGKYLSSSGIIGEERQTAPTPILNYASRNGYRQRSSHRLDLNASFVKKKPNTERTWIITVYNAYNRRNPVFIESRPTQNFDGLDWNLRFKEYSFLSIIPSVTYRLSF